MSNVSDPTKSNLRKMKEQLTAAREGFDLLEQKRELLVLELLKRLADVRNLEQEIEPLRKLAWSALGELLATVGRWQVERQGLGVVAEFQFRQGYEKIAGIRLPTLDSVPPEMTPGRSFDPTGAVGDATRVAFLRLSGHLARLAATRAQVWRLAFETRKTQRRVNALEKIVIPQTEAAATAIAGVLEEREREGLFAMKLLKASREE